MANDISVFGGRIQAVCSMTFPAGISLTQFSDDQALWDIASIKIREATMGANGDLITYSKANPITLNLSVIPGSDDDVNLSILFNLNRPQRGRGLVRDKITFGIFYPGSSKIVTLTEGCITDGMVTPGAEASGRLKTNVYGFAFEGIA